MMPAWGPVTLASLAICVLSHVALSRRMQRRPRASRRGAWLEVAAAVRWVASVPPIFALLLPIFELASTWPAPARWSVSGVVGLLLAAVVGNTLAGLWVLSPLVGLRLGMALGGARRRGVITRYGWFALELTTDEGWTLALPYANLPLRPWVLRKPEQPHLVDVRLRRERWDEDDLRRLRQACVLLPYRDLGAPVRISRRASSVVVRLAVIGKHATEAIEQQLENVLAAERDLPPPSLPPRA